MIKNKLIRIEIEAKANINKEYQRLNAIKNINELLLQIDFSAEIVPMEDSDKLKDLLASLKGDQLSGWEDILVKEIVG